MATRDPEASAEARAEVRAGADAGRQATVAYSPHAIHLMRTAQLNTLQLSQMADQKASILLAADALNVTPERLIAAHRELAA